MTICRVIGNVTLAKSHPSLQGAVWRICVPMTSSELAGAAAAGQEPFVTYDELGAGLGALVAVSDGAEASAPFYPDQKPIDAYNAAILDAVEVAAPVGQE
jgi:ethanolamine utilization protein EutN